MENLDDRKKRRFKGLIIALVLLGAVGLTSVLTVWLAKLYLFPKTFQPVQLSTSEQTVLNQKIKAITSKRPARKTQTRGTKNADAVDTDTPLAPEPYHEKDANRKISLNERELNALLAKNTDLADKVAIDLSNDIASVKILIPLDPELPFFGGKTLKVTAGLELRHDQQNPTAILKGVSVWGVPMPNAWLGGMKNADLIKILGADGGFWKTFSAGIDELRIEDGRLTIQLAE